LLDNEEKIIGEFSFSGAWPKSWSGPVLGKSADGTEFLKEELVISIGDVEMR